jgi:hypothetical protein
MDVTPHIIWQTCRIGDLSIVKSWPPCVLHRRVKRQTLVYIASKYGNLALLHWLSEQGLDLSISNERNITPFSAAIKHGHLMAAHFLYTKGVDCNAADINLNTPFLYACMRGHMECAKWLHRVGVDLAWTNRDNEDALMLACRFGHLRFADWLRSVHPFRRYKDIMRTACDIGHLSVVKWVCIVAGEEYLHDAPAIYHACKNGNIAIVKWLVQKGASVNVTHNGKTPFYAAATRYQMDLMVWLYLNGASINTPDAEGFTPLRRICAMRVYNDHFYSYAVWLILNGAVSDRMGNVSKVALRKEVGRDRKMVRANMKRLVEWSARCAWVLCQIRRNLMDDVVAHIADYVGILRGRRLRNARQTLCYL